MKIDLKQELAKQWFKNLQEIVCKNIEEIENNKILFKSKKQNRNKKKNEGGGDYKIFIDPYRVGLSNEGDVIIKGNLQVTFNDNISFIT